MGRCLIPVGLHVLLCVSCSCAVFTHDLSFERIEDLSAPELKKLQRKERKAQHKAAQAKALEEKKGECDRAVCWQVSCTLREKSWSLECAANDWCFKNTCSHKKLQTI